MNFVAIDFETANLSPHSICAVGLVVVENGIITNRYKQLIQPPNNEYTPFHSFLHGIRPADTENAPTFNVVFNQFLSYIENNLIIAHNASFDMSVLRHTMSYYDITYPNLNYLCTKFLAQKCWTNRTSYGLDCLTDDLNIELSHHEPLSDAIACATIAVMACKTNNIVDMNELAQKLNLSIGSIFPGGYSPCRLNNKQKILRARNILPSITDFNVNSPIYEKCFVFTGTLSCMVRKEAFQFVIDKGGICSDTVNNNTDYLVLGLQDYTKFRSGTKSNKQKKTEKLIESGKNIEIISEDDFIRMLTC